jgi:uncharacterized membrane protein YcgQ (UPF0703/DUF1980 family)
VKKFFIIFLFFANCYCAFADSKIIEIKERMFIAQMNDIYLNSKDYLGRTIKYEGIFKKYEALANAPQMFYVIRYGPGCCGNDAMAGFEIKCGEHNLEDGDWVEVCGIVEEYFQDGFSSLRINASQIKKMEKRGKEVVRD